MMRTTMTQAGDTLTFDTNACVYTIKIGKEYQALHGRFSSVEVVGVAKPDPESPDMIRLNVRHITGRKGAVRTVNAASVWRHYDVPRSSKKTEQIEEGPPPATSPSWADLDLLSKKVQATFRAVESRRRDEHFRMSILVDELWAMIKPNIDKNTFIEKKIEDNKKDCPF
jgi:hypothetical protein